MRGRALCFAHETVSDLANGDHWQAPERAWLRARRAGKHAASAAAHVLLRRPPPAAASPPASLSAPRRVPRAQPQHCGAAPAPRHPPPTCLRTPGRSHVVCAPCCGDCMRRSMVHVQQQLEPKWVSAVWAKYAPDSKASSHSHAGQSRRTGVVYGDARPVHRS